MTPFFTFFSAYPSFVQEFVSGQFEGVACLLEALKTIQSALEDVSGLREQRKMFRFVRYRSKNLLWKWTQMRRCNVDNIRFIITKFVRIYSYQFFLCFQWWAEMSSMCIPGFEVSKRDKIYNFCHYFCIVCEGLEMGGLSERIIKRLTWKISNKPL